MGATEIKVAPMRKNEKGIVLGETVKFPTNAALGKAGITSALERAIASLVSEEVDGIAIASAGDIDTKTSTITYATENLPGMIGFDFAEFCKEKFNLPDQRCARGSHWRDGVRSREGLCRPARLHAYPRLGRWRRIFCRR